MPAADNAPDEFVYDAAAQLRHDLRNPLTTMSARAYLVGRAIQRAPGLSEPERAMMLAGLTSIEGAVQQLVTVIDGRGRENPAR